MTSLKYLYAGIKIGSYTSHIIHIAWETKTSDSVASGKMLDHDLAPIHHPARASDAPDHTASPPTRASELERPRNRSSHIA